VNLFHSSAGSAADEQKQDEVVTTGDEIYESRKDFTEDYRAT
jgi:hypothetical protein